jgi:hypothetical protein
VALLAFHADTEERIETARGKRPHGAQRAPKAAEIEQNREKTRSRPGSAGVSFRRFIEILFNFNDLRLN